MRSNEGDLDMAMEVLFSIGAVAAFVFFAAMLGAADYYTQDAREKGEP